MTSSFDQVGELDDARLSPRALVGVINRHNHRGDDDYCTQAGDLYRLMSSKQRSLRIDNIVGAMKSVPAFVQQRQIAHFMRADAEYGTGVARGLAAVQPGDPRQVPVVE